LIDGALRRVVRGEKLIVLCEAPRVHGGEGMRAAGRKSRSPLTKSSASRTRSASSRRRGRAPRGSCRPAPVCSRAATLREAGSGGAWLSPTSPLDETSARG
jgi:hypothetical protein